MKSRELKSKMLRLHLHPRFQCCHVKGAWLVGLRTNFVTVEHHKKHGMPPSDWLDGRCYHGEAKTFEKALKKAAQNWNEPA